MTADEIMALKKGDRVGHADCPELCFKVHKVDVDEDEEENGSVTRTVRRVHVESVYSSEGWEFEDGDRRSNLDKIARPPMELVPTRGEIWKRQLDDHEKLAARSFAGFQLVSGHRHVYPELRRWVFRHPDHRNHAFSLVAWPGYLFVGGDLDECVWTRSYDMIEWATGAVRDPQYFAGKVVNPIKTREWCSELATAWVWEEWAGRVERLLMEGERSGGWRRNKEHTVESLTETRDELLAHIEDGQHAFGYHAYTHTDWMDGGDYPNLERYTCSYLWARSAVQVGLRLLGHLPR